MARITLVWMDEFRRLVKKAADDKLLPNWVLEEFAKYGCIEEDGVNKRFDDGKLSG